MSSRYPILDNRPIDQWKVTELKEELKRRKLTIKGLKEDLIKRLDEALRVEREEAAEAAEIEAASEAAEEEASEAAEKDEAAKAAEKEEPTKSAEKEEAAETAEKEEAAVKEEAAEAAKKEEVNGFEPDPQPVAGLKDSQTVTVVAEVVETTGRGGAEIVETAAKGNTGVVEPIPRENAENSPEVVGDDSNKNDKLDGNTVAVDVTNSVPPTNQEEVGHDDLPTCVDSVGVGENLAVHGSTVETSIAVSENVLKEVVASGQDSYNTETQKENGGSATKLENEESRAQLETEDSKPQLDGGTEPPCEDVMPHTSASGNQVSEVYPSLGSQVKYDSLSSDSVSINEKNELKDNIIADNVKLEQDFVRPEMVVPSSSNIAPVYDESHSVDFGEQHEKKASLEENSNNVTSPDLNKATSIEDVVYPEKLNLDRSSGDDSMEEDLPESKQFDSKFNAADARERRESSEVPVGREESNTKVVGEGLSTRKTDYHDDDDIHPVVLAEKRKFHDQAFLGNNEPGKRQRRWNSEAVKVADPQSTNLTPATTPKDEPVALRHNLSRSDSSATDDAPKERIVPPPQSSATNSLRIDRFLRPFTLKAVQELLGKTGNVVSFWMDHIKTHCYVTYSSVEEATETRNAVYNLQWPPNGGRLLVAEFVDSQEVKMKLEAPPVQAAVSSGPAVPPTLPTSKPEPSPRQHREQPPVPPALPPPPPMSKAPPAARERLPSPPSHPEKVDPPIVTLDDLFRKTRSTPRIYYLPLSEEQVAAKLAAEGKSTKT